MRNTASFSRTTTRTSATIAAIAGLLTLAPGLAQADPLLEQGGQLHFGATDFDELVPQNDGDAFEIVPTENPGLPAYSNARATCDPLGEVRYMYIDDNYGNDSQTSQGAGGRPPWQGGNAVVIYEFTITTPGDYRM